jgi:signal transduction histidine kinase
MSRQVAAASSAAPESARTSQGLLESHLHYVRVAWIVVAAFAVGLLAYSIRVEFATLLTVCPTDSCETGQLPAAGLRSLRDFGLPTSFYAGFAVTIDTILAAVYCAVSAAVFWRKSADLMAIFASLTLLVFGTATFPNAMDLLAVVHPSWWLPVVVLGSLGSVCMSVFLYTFPDGRFVPRWTIWVALAGIAWQILEYLVPGWISGVWPGRFRILVWSVFLLIAVFAQTYRYRRVSNVVQKLQTKWVVFGISTALLILLGTMLALIASHPVPSSSRSLAALLLGSAVYSLGMLLIPLSIGVAILRFRLWDIDLIINRTLVYATLTAGVVGLYVLVVGGVGVILRVQGNLLVSILAAGLVAVLFQPVRERLQRAINHLMYGKRDDPYAVLSHLGVRLESTLAPDEVLPAVTRTVREALKLPYAEIQLQHKEGFETAAASGASVDDTLLLPLIYGGETVGRLVLGLRAGEESFSPEEERLFEDLAHQIGVAAHATLMGNEARALSADLQRSRERLVSAREEERRRLRRDLHDGLGPQLASLTMTAEAARDLISTDPRRAEELLAGVMERAQDAVSDVRRLVYELRPPALDALGLLAALRAYADHHTEGGIRVTVESPSALPPLPAAVEVAAYRIAMEALNNVARHASARNCKVRLSLDEEAGMLALEVSDDGRGIEGDYEPGVGLYSMRERAEELGGSCAIEALPSGGTRVTALLPCALDGTDQTGLRGGT